MNLLKFSQNRKLWVKNLLKVIEVRELWYKYPNGNLALRNINLDIFKGERVVIVGENGAGKTTLIKHFIGLLKPYKGYVKVLDKDTRKCSVAELSRYVGIVFQNPMHQFFNESVWDEVAFSLKIRGFSEDEIKVRVKNILDELGLSRYAQKSPFSLSGGEMRRLALATVLVYDPEVVIFDEPTVGLDPYQAMFHPLFLCSKSHALPSDNLKSKMGHSEL